MFVEVVRRYLGSLPSEQTGWLAGLNAARTVRGLPPVVPPERSMLGGLVRYLSSANPEGFQPMNANWGLVPDAPERKGASKKERREALYDLGLASFTAWLAEVAPWAPGAAAGPSEPVAAVGAA